MKPIYSLSALCLLLLLFLPSRSLNAANDLTTYPYGGTVVNKHLKEPFIGQLVSIHFPDDAFLMATTFSENADFSEATFSKKVYFSLALFANNADFRGANFSENADFDDALFADNADFGGANFFENADFSEATFSKKVCYKNTIFSKEVNFELCQFNHTVSFSGTNFKEGIDLRRADFSKTKTIFIDHNTLFPNGKLVVNWQQLIGHIQLDSASCHHPALWNRAQNERTKNHSLSKDTDSLVFLQLEKNPQASEVMVSLEKDNAPANRLDRLTQLFNQERYDLTEIFYLRLRDNYLAQNNKVSADAVMYELAERKADILNEPLWILYGWIMGWGYKPVQFLLAVFLLVALPFALFWYRCYYQLVLPLVDHAIDDAFKEQLKAPENLNKKSHFNHAAIAGEIIFPARVWHVIFFSTSVLLGIRFKKEWIEKKDRAFLWWVTAEWLIGIGLYILFAVLVKSNEFSYVKGLLGLS